MGSVLCGCIAASCREVIGVDVQQGKVDAINRGQSPIVEPDLDSLIGRAVAAGTLRATCDVLDAVRSSELTMVCVGTPSDREGDADLHALTRVCTDIGQALRHTDHFHCVVFRSTVSPGTTRRVAIPILERESGKRTGGEFGVGYNPEFMREGNAVADFFSPPFTVIATLDSLTTQRLETLYEKVHAPQVELELESAELLKSVCNGFHAMKAAFANEIGALCAAIEVDGSRMMEVFCQDTKLNLSPKYLRPGFAFGGSCLPKDLKALARLAESHRVHVPLLRGILESNDAHIRRAEDLIIATGKSRVGMLGLTFKTGTDDTRESPALSIARTLLKKGCDVWVYEPDLDTDRLVGVNRDYIAEAFPNFTSWLVGSTQALAQCTEVLVVTKSDSRYKQMLVDLTPHHVVVDLVGFFAGQSLPCPQITLC